MKPVLFLAIMASVLFASPANASETAVIVGDSLVWGRDWRLGGSPEKPIDVLLSEKFPERTFINLGRNSIGTKTLASNMKKAVAHQPTTVIVWIGINDVSTNVSSRTIKKNLTRIYNYYISKGYEVWALTITPSDKHTTKQYATRCKVNKWILRLGEIGKIKVFDASKAISDPANPKKRNPAYADPYSPNHINADGYAAIVELMD